MPETPLPPAARLIRTATLDAVLATRSHDVAAFDEAAGRLATADPEQVRLVLGTVVRTLLEIMHPDGIAADDLLDLIRACARWASGWYPGLDVQALVVVLTGALGVHEPDEEPRRVTPDEVARHAPLFIRTLMDQPGAATDHPGQSLSAFLDDALARLATAQLNEMP